MGEVSSPLTDYVAPYQNALDATFNYPLYYTMRDVFAHGKSLTLLSQMYKDQTTKFRDVDALGIFVDNHDVPRFLNDNSEIKLFKSALVFSLTARGIPFFYQGDEQSFNGGNDPYNREALFGKLNDSSDLYLFVAMVMRSRSVLDIS